jgi:hypothetical protein
MASFTLLVLLLCNVANISAVVFGGMGYGFMV